MHDKLGYTRGQGEAVSLRALPDWNFDPDDILKMCVFQGLIEPMQHVLQLFALGLFMFRLLGGLKGVLILAECLIGPGGY